MAPVLKVYGRMRPGPNGACLSRKAIFAEIDDSLRRLGMDYVDLYQIHRSDRETSIEETLEALHDLVRAGKSRAARSEGVTMPREIVGKGLWFSFAACALCPHLPLLPDLGITQAPHTAV